LRRLSDEDDQEGRMLTASTEHSLHVKNYAAPADGAIIWEGSTIADIALFTLTDAGIKAAKDSPRRLDAAKKLLGWPTLEPGLGTNCSRMMAEPVPPSGRPSRRVNRATLTSVAPCKKTASFMGLKLWQIPSSTDRTPKVLSRPRPSRSAL
jgi:hypothetical protein